MAQSKPMAVDRWPQRGRPARKGQRLVLKPAAQQARPSGAVARIHSVNAAVPSPVDLRSVRTGRAAFLVSTIAFSGIGAAAVGGIFPMWLLVPVLAGLAVTGFVYVACWVLDNVTPW